MKKLFSILLIFSLLTQAFAQVPDTSTFEKKARYKIGRIRDNTVRAITPADFRGAFTAIADMTAKRVPFLTPSEVRAGKADTARVIEVMDGLRSGRFSYKSGSSEVDDSSMVLVSNGRKYHRIVDDIILPEWFGAVPNDRLNDQIAIQKALNYIAKIGGGHLQFNVGKYYLYDNIKPKRTADKRTYKLKVSGKGIGTTMLQDTTGMIGKTMIGISLQTGDLTGDYNSYVEFYDLTINGLYADTVLSIKKSADVSLKNLIVAGGMKQTAYVGSSYKATIQDCYFNARNYQDGHSESCINVTQIYAKIIGCTTDGGSYGIKSSGASMEFVQNNIEGSKVAGIYAKSNGGGKNIIIGNSIRPYSGYERFGRFKGESNGIYLEGESGGVSKNNVVGNSIFMLNPTTELNKVMILSGVTGNFNGRASNVGYRITGSISGATAQVLGYSPTDTNIVITDVVGVFQNGETITQATEGATGKIESQPVNVSYGITLVNSTGNTLSANVIDGNPSFAINNRSGQTVINGNFLETSLGGIYNTGSATLNGNRIQATATAIQDISSGITWSGNSFTGSLVGVNPQSQLKAGTVTAGTAPLKFTSGPLLTTAEPGAIEFLTDKFYGTITTGAARREFLTVPTGVITSGAIPYGAAGGTLATNGGLYFDTSKGGSLYLNTMYGAGTGNLNVTATATASGSFPIAVFKAGAHTAQTASTELIDFNVDLNRTLQFSTGPKATQRAAVFSAPTYSAVGATVTTNAATLAVTNAPTAGTNMTITNSHALWVQAGTSTFDGRVKASSTVNLSGIPTYADNAAAIAGSLVVGDVYKTATGELRIRY